MRSLALCSLLCMGVASAAETLMLVQGGQPRADIVLAAAAPESVREAARELQDGIRKQTGATLAIVTDADADPGRTLVLLGNNRFTRELGLANRAWERGETLIVATPTRLALLGADEPDMALAAIHGNSWCDKRFFLRTGTLYAVYRLLEEAGGFRWYWPGELGEAYVERPDFAVPLGESPHRPAMRFRTMFAYSAVPEALWVWPRTDVYNMNFPKLSDAEQLRWGRQIRQGGLPFACNHNQDSFHSRFGKEHPDWFANRSTQAGSQLCYSNPEVFAQVVQDARDFFDYGSTANHWNMGDYFAVMPSDTASWCSCEPCQAKFRPDLLGTDFSNGHASEYVWDFVVRVANEVKKTHPDKFIACCAYWEYFLPPTIAIPDNVAVMICRERTRNYDDAFLNRIRDNVKAWRAKTPNIFLWDYYLFPESPGFEHFPQIDPRHIAADQAFLRDAGVTGGVMMQMDEAFMRNIVLEHLRVYVNLRLMYDTRRGVDELLDEYYRLFYGPAEAPMRKFWDGLETLYYDNRPESDEYSGSEYDWLVLCTPDKLAAFAKLLDEAAALAPADSVHARRIAKVREGLFEPVLAGSSALVTKRSQERQTLTVKKVAPFAVDANPDKEPWLALPRADGWNSYDGGPLQRPTYAQAAYDDKNLYVLFVCEDPAGYTPAPESVVYGAQPFRDDSVELFVDVGRKLGKTGFYQIVANTVPVLYDNAVQFPDKQGWKSDANVVARPRDGGGWVVEMAVPLASLGVEKIAPGDVWGLNFCRNLSEKSIHGFGSRFMNWSGPYGYLNPARFGIATFE